MPEETWYEKQLKTPQWRVKRLEIFERDNYECVDCGNPGVTFDCHHEHYVSGKYPWDYPSYALVTVCRGCHKKRHTGKIIAFASHEDAEIWWNFSQIEAGLTEMARQVRDDCIDDLEERGAIWDAKGQYYSLVDENGEVRHYGVNGDPI